MKDDFEYVTDVFIESNLELSEKKSRFVLDEKRLRQEIEKLYHKKRELYHENKIHHSHNSISVFN